MSCSGISKQDNLEVIQRLISFKLTSYLGLWLEIPFLCQDCFLQPFLPVWEEHEDIIMETRRSLRLDQKRKDQKPTHQGQSTVNTSFCPVNFLKPKKTTTVQLRLGSPKKRQIQKYLFLVMLLSEPSKFENIAFLQDGIQILIDFYTMAWREKDALNFNKEHYVLL